MSVKYSASPFASHPRERGHACYQQQYRSGLGNRLYGYSGRDSAKGTSPTFQKEYGESRVETRSTIAKSENLSAFTREGVTKKFVCETNPVIPSNKSSGQRQRRGYSKSIGRTGYDESNRIGGKLQQNYVTGIISNSSNRYWKRGINFAVLTIEWKIQCYLSSTYNEHGTTHNLGKTRIESIDDGSLSR